MSSPASPSAGPGSPSAPSPSEAASSTSAPPRSAPMTSPGDSRSARVPESISHHRFTSTSVARGGNVVVHDLREGEGATKPMAPADPPAEEDDVLRDTEESADLLLGKG